MSRITDTPYVCEVGDHRRKYASKEEAYEAHKARVRKWQQQNPDKHNANVKRYNSKPERAAHIKEVARIKYQENKEEIRAKQRAFYQANKERIRADNREKYRARKEQNDPKL